MIVEGGQVFELEIRLVNERRGLQRGTGANPLALAPGNASKVLIHERYECRRHAPRLDWRAQITVDGDLALNTAGHSRLPNSRCHPTRTGYSGNSHVPATPDADPLG